MDMVRFRRFWEPSGNLQSATSRLSRIHSFLPLFRGHRPVPALSGYRSGNSVPWFKIVTYRA